MLLWITLWYDVHVVIMDGMACSGRVSASENLWKDSIAGIGFGTSLCL